MAGDVSRRNGARSRGPVSEKGKERSRRNALRHGLAASTLRPDAGKASASAGPAAVLTGEQRRRALERARVLGLPVSGGHDDVLTALSLAVADADLEIEAIERRKIALIEEAILLAELDATLREQHHAAIEHAPFARAKEPRPPVPQAGQARHDDEDAARAVTELKTVSLPRQSRRRAALGSLGVVGSLDRVGSPGRVGSFGVEAPGGEGSPVDLPREKSAVIPASVELAAWADAVDGIRRLDRYAERAETRRRRAWLELQRRLHQGRAEDRRS